MKSVDATPDEMEAAVGEQLRALRIHRNIDQKTLAERAGVSVRALRNLESGAGSTLHTMVCVLRALGREDWLRSVGPVATINPLMLSRSHAPRQRASKARKAGETRPGPA
ncbi:helix-turn-helix domain-containing protein [Variovorax sp. JS1663]|uniref:helix-turn-helix domain-containing protein n=1 Tax=Variovorax sp. JS1663 TaxID=1851577 RepID=UPI001EE0F528|nr:helix-turn-helix transcriptional regulator [Variovorax sp. JS1663]